MICLNDFLGFYFFLYDHGKICFTNKKQSKNKNTRSNIKAALCELCDEGRGLHPYGARVLFGLVCAAKHDSLESERRGMSRAPVTSLQGAADWRTREEFSIAQLVWLAYSSPL